VLAHAKKENDEQKLQALAFIGDCVEEEPADLYAIADELGKRDVRLLMFQEGENHRHERVSRGRTPDQGRTLSL
jgi:hypothetical protein